MDAILAAIGSSPPAAALRASFVAYPLVSAAHVLGAGGLVVLVWLMHAALAGRAGSDGPDAARLYRRLVVALLVLMALSGLALFSVRPADYAANPAFRIKLALVSAALLNVAVHHAIAARRPGLARLSAIVSVTLWPAILVAGRFVGFV
jgi:hypothetical protein